MNKNAIILMGGGPYETPTLSLFEIENEGAICAASTQQFETPDDNDLLDW